MLTSEEKLKVLVSDEQEECIRNKYSSGKFIGNKAHLKFLSEFFEGTEWENAVERLGKIFSELPTDYQDSHFYSIMSNAASALNRVIENKRILDFDGNRIELKPMPVFITLESDDCNASVEWLNEAKAIMFSNRFIRLIERLIELVVEEIIRQAKGIAGKETRDILTKNFIDIMSMHYIHKEHDAYFAKPIDLLLNDNIYDSDFYQYREALSTATYMWIVAHEYSHIVLEHNGKADYSCYSESIVDEILQRDYNWSLEDEADRLGVLFVYNSKYKILLAEGVMLALYAMMIGNENAIHRSTTHPPLSLRVESIVEYMKKLGIDISDCRTIIGILKPKIEAWKRFIIKYYNKKSDSLSRDELQELIYNNAKELNCADDL